jgi:hypothetical protein
MGIKLCECLDHVIVVTEQTQWQVERLRRELNSGFTLTPLIVTPYKYADIIRKFREGNTWGGRHVGFNITGGTKPMSAAALDFCRETELTPFYIDTKMRKVHFFKEPFNELAMPPVFSSVDEFIRLGGYSVASPGLVTSNLSVLGRTELARLFWKNRWLVCRWNDEFSNATSRKYQNTKIVPEPFADAVNQMLDIAVVKCPELEKAWMTTFPPKSDWREAAHFSGGKWFEEYCLNILRPPLFTGAVDLRFGFKVGWDGVPPTNSPFEEAQDMDIVFTDGYDLMIIECKAGKLKQEYIQKLENLRAVFGGAHGKAILVSVNPPSNKSVALRIKSSRGVMLVCDEACAKLGRHVDKVKPGVIVGMKKDNEIDGSLVASPAKSTWGRGIIW